MNPPIFISYSSKDQAIAETIYQALEARGQNCWIACRDVAPGENYQEAIVRALRAAKVMLLVFTSNANNSDEIKKELVLAGRHRVTVVPVRVEDVVPNDAFSYELATRQWVDLFKDWEGAIEQLSVQLGRLLQTPKADVPASGVSVAPTLTPRVPPPKPPSLRPVGIGAGVIAAAAIAGFLIYQHKSEPAVVSTPQQTTAPPPVIMRVPPPQTAGASPPPAASPSAPAATAPAAPVTTSPPAPPPAATAPPDPAEAAWQAALATPSIEALRAYQKSFPGTAHAQEAELRLLDLILAAPATTSKTFDGAWMTTWTCPAAGQGLGYTFQFVTQVKDGALHGVRGTPGERGALILDGKIESDGAAAILGKGVVGSANFAVGGQAAGTPYTFHAKAHFDKTAGTGERIEGRTCNATFMKQ